ncbi:hypothetical protein D9M73_120760 [compost metagenome]
MAAQPRRPLAFGIDHGCFHARQSGPKRRLIGNGRECLTTLYRFRLGQDEGHHLIQRRSSALND